MTWIACIVSNIVLASLLAMAAWIVQRWFRRPGIAHVFWVLALIKLITPPLVKVPLQESPNNLSCALGACNCLEHQQPRSEWRDRLPWVLLVAWSVGASATGWIALRRWAIFRRLLFHARPAPPDLQALAARLASELSICAPDVVLIPGRLPPMVIPGWRRRRLVLPMGLLASLNASQRVAMLLHELAHLKRRDHLVRVLEMIVGIAYWWLPFIGAIGRRLRACEELCCDAMVMARRPDVRRDYAKLLLDVVDFASPLARRAIPHATAMSSAARDLEQRLRAILHVPVRTHSGWPVVAMALALACGVLPFSLHYDLVAQLSPTARPNQTDPTVEVAAPTGEECGVPVAKFACCPS